jgi:hypothetical protein
VNQLAPGHLYTLAMLAGGLAIGVATVIAPNWSAGIPPLLFLLAVSLIFDVVWNQRVAAGSAPPLPFNWRVIGFLAGGVLSIAIPYAAGVA